jgi:ubiquitin C-terminal hydrolase
MNKFGIINFSNNCYLNVIIQLFLSNKNTSNIIMHFLDIIKKNNGNLINPKKLLSKINEKMNTLQQNDSQEAFTIILDLIPDLEKYYVNKIKNYYTCEECGKVRNKIDIFSTFYIHTNSLEDSVKQLIQKEQFELECEHCKKNTNTIKTCKIKKLGDILVFYNIVKNKLKITENIIFNDNNYKLTGLIKHYGNQNSGHYIYIDYQNKYIIDDTEIKPLDKLSLDNIYLLFYTI